MGLKGLVGAAGRLRPVRRRSEIRVRGTLLVSTLMPWLCAEK
jgi:hypothetical protein